MWAGINQSLLFLQKHVRSQTRFWPLQRSLSSCNDRFSSIFCICLIPLVVADWRCLPVSAALRDAPTTSCIANKPVSSFLLLFPSFFFFSARLCCFVFLCIHLMCCIYFFLCCFLRCGVLLGWLIIPGWPLLQRLERTARRFCCGAEAARAAALAQEYQPVWTATPFSAPPDHNALRTDSAFHSPSAHSTELELGAL
jgi:hypothetical protein